MHLAAFSKALLIVAVSSQFVDVSVAQYAYFPSVFPYYPGAFMPPAYYVYRAPPSFGQPLAFQVEANEPSQKVKVNAQQNKQSPTADSIEIHVQQLDGKIYTLQVLTSDTIESVKKQLQDAGAPLNGQSILAFGGKPLKDDSTLSENNITKSGTTLLLNVRSPPAKLSDAGDKKQSIQRGSIKIFIRILKGPSIINFDVDTSDTIASVKAKISESQGFKVENQLLVLNDEVLEDDKTLADYNITQDSPLRLIARAESPSAPSPFKKAASRPSPSRF